MRRCPLLVPLGARGREQRRHLLVRRFLPSLPLRRLPLLRPCRRGLLRIRRNGLKSAKVQRLVPLAARKPANQPQPKKSHKGRSRQRCLLHPLRRDVVTLMCYIFLRPVPLAARAREKLGGKPEKAKDGNNLVGRGPNGRNGLDGLDQPLVVGNGQLLKGQSWTLALSAKPTMTNSK